MKEILVPIFPTDSDSAKQNSVTESAGYSNEKNVVRVFPQSMTKPFEVFTCFDHLYGGDVDTQISNLWFTNSIWIVKDKDTKNPGELMMPGGEIKNKLVGKEITTESVDEAGRREIWEELHIPHTRGDERFIAARKYSFDQGQELRNEVTLSGKVPAFIAPTSVHISNKIAHIPQLSPADLETLFINDSFRNAPLLESLQKDLPDGVEVAEIFSNDDLREQTLTEAFSYELNIRKKVLDRFFCKHYPDPDCNQLIKNQIGEILGSPGEQPQQGDNSHSLKNKIEALNTFFTTYIQSDINLTNDQVRDTLQVATEETYLEECVPLFENSGPQAPYLASQILLEFSRITPHELDLIKTVAPETYALHNSVRQAYADDPDSDNWYFDAQRTIARMRDIKAKAQEDRTEQEHSEYESRTNRFIADYLTSIGMEDEAEHTRSTEDWNNFLKYWQRSIAKHVSPQTAARVFADPLLTRTSSPEERMFVRYGFIQYGKKDSNSPDPRGDTDVDLSKPYNRTTPWQVERGLIGASQMPKVNEIHDVLASRRIYRTRQAVYSSFTENISTDTSGPFESYETRLATNKVLTFEYNNTVITVPLNSVGVDYYVGDKTRESTTRKLLERGDIDNIDESTKIDDVQRWSLRAKAGQESVNFGQNNMREQLVAQGLSTEEANELLPYIGRETMKHFMVEMFSQVQAKSNTVAVRKVQTSRAMTGIIDEIKAELQEQLGSDVYNQKFRFTNGNYNGSGATIENKPWSWFKLVVEVDGMPSEFQLFPTDEDYKLKVADDDRFDRERMVMVHGKNRYALIDALIAPQTDVRDKLIEKASGNGKNH